MKAILGAACAVLLFSAHARAQDVCFSVAGAAAPRAQQIVGLHDVVRVDAQCRFAVHSHGPWLAAGALAGRDTDFAEVFDALARQSPRPDGDARVVYARAPGSRRGAVAAPQTLMLRYCAHYLLEEQLGFRAVPSSDGASFRIERVTPAECDAARVELRAVPGAEGEALSSTVPAHTLGAAQPSLSLPEGDWTLYAARPGGAAGLRVGVFSAHRAVTPLQHRLRSAEADAPPLLVAVWRPTAPGLLLHPSLRTQAEPMVWPELRTAADAGLLWLARTVRGEARVIAPIALEAEPVAVRLPDAVVREAMVERYGEAGVLMTPVPSDWRAILGGLDVCLTADYRAPRAASAGDAVPEGSACAALGLLTTFAQAEAGIPAAPGRVCLERGMQVMSSDRATHVAGQAEPTCFPLPEPADETPTVQRFLVAGDSLRLEGEGLCVTVDGTPVEPTEGGVFVLPRAGLLEVRQGAWPQCSSQQGLARLRLPVLDPEREWHPVGLYTGADPAAMRCGDGGDEDDESAGTCPWRAVRHDESTTFAYVRSRHDLEWRLAASPAVAAAVNADPSQPVQLTESIPTLGGVRGRFDGARPPAIVAVHSRDATCPTEPYAELRERPPLDPDGMLPDASLYVFLAAVEGDDAPLHCIARAKLRVRPSRVLLATGFADVVGLELGLLGDTRAVFFLTEPLAMGVSLTVAYFRASFWRIFAIEAGGGLVIAAAFPTSMTTTPGMTADVPAQVSRLGAALTATLEVGIPEYLPRLLSFGGMLHAAAETHAVSNPIGSLFIGLNLSSLVDLAGGR